MTAALSKIYRLCKTWAFMIYAVQINRFSRRPIVGDANCTVSLTTFGSRIDSVFYTLESIGQGKVRPSRIILWVDDKDRFTSLPGSLIRLRERGVEIILTENYGPHTKYYPYVATQSLDSLPLVTADDDVIYARSWLVELLKVHNQFPNDIIAHRAHYVEVSGNAILPYRQWSASNASVKRRNFATGVSGVLYPSAFQRYLRSQGSCFLDVAPKADDIWLHVMSLRSDTAVRQVKSAPGHYLSIRGSQANNLWSSNVFSGGNDGQVHASYTKSDIAKLIENEFPNS